jgi:hypothetical protein
VSRSRSRTVRNRGDPALRRRNHGTISSSRSRSSSAAKRRGEKSRKGPFSSSRMSAIRSHRALPEIAAIENASKMVRSDIVWNDGQSCGGGDAGVVMRSRQSTRHCSSRALSACQSDRAISARGCPAGSTIREIAAEVSGVIASGIRLGRACSRSHWFFKAKQR